MGLHTLTSGKLRLTSKGSCDTDTRPAPAALASSTVAASGSKPSGQAHTNSKSNLAASRIQECTMLLPSPTYVTWRAALHWSALEDVHMAYQVIMMTINIIKATYHHMIVSPLVTPGNLAS